VGSGTVLGGLEEGEDPGPGPAEESVPVVPGVRGCETAARVGGLLTRVVGGDLPARAAAVEISALVVALVVAVTVAEELTLVLRVRVGVVEVVMVAPTGEEEVFRTLLVVPE